MKHGLGTYYYANGDVFDGQYVNGTRFEGVLTMANGNKYVGQFDNDKMHGEGQLLMKDGSSYVGEFRENKRCGRGRLYRHLEYYEGLWREDEKEGVGFCILYDGRAERQTWDAEQKLKERAPVKLADFPTRPPDYQMSMSPTSFEMLCLARESLGEKIYWNDAVGFVETWVAVRIFSYLQPAALCAAAQVCRSWKRLADDNVFWRDLGVHTMSWQDLFEYDFDWKRRFQCRHRKFGADDHKEGRGCYDWQNGNVYVGEWKDNMRQGWGEMTYHNGDLYIGNWSEDKKHGLGFVKYANGATYKGERERESWRVFPHHFLNSFCLPIF